MREVQEAFEFEHFGMRKILYEQMVRAIVLYIVQNSGMFCMFSLFTDCICFVRVCYTDIYAYISLYFGFIHHLLGANPAILCIFLWCLMAGSRDNWPWHVVTQTLQNLERKKQINKKQLGPFRHFCLQQWDDLWMKIHSLFLVVFHYWRLEDVFFCVF